MSLKMSLKFSPDKKRVHCEGCRQFQPVVTQQRDGANTLVCAACLHGISAQANDLKDAAEIVKGELAAVETVVSLTEEGRKALGENTGKPLPKLRVETRPARAEGTR